MSQFDPYRMIRSKESQSCDMTERFHPVAQREIFKGEDINYISHLKSLAYFSHLAAFVLSLLKDKVKKGERGHRAETRQCAPSPEIIFRGP